MSRTSLEVEPISRTHYILGKGFNTKINNNIRKQVGDQTILMELQFIYLDSDLCITMSKSGASSSGDSGILNVYTKVRRNGKQLYSISNLFGHNVDIRTQNQKYLDSTIIHCTTKPLLRIRNGGNRE